MMTATRGTRRGSRAFPLMRIRRPSHRGAVMLPTPRLTGATCRARPHLRRSMVSRCHHRAGHRRRGTTRLWGRARVRWLLLSKWAFGRPAPARRPTGRALPSRQDLRPVRSIPLGGRRSVRCPSASSTMVRITRTLTPCRGTGRGGGRQTRCQHQRSAGGGTEHRPAALAVTAYPGWRGPGCSCAPYRR
jgi:hypothetical protein